MTTNDIMESEKAIMGRKKLPPNLRIYLLNKKRYIRVHNGSIESGWSVDDFGISRAFSLDRGKILDLFARLEFFINELIRLKLIGWDNPNYQMLEDILERVDLFSRVELLHSWGIIDGVLKNFLMQTKKTRNGLAHKWRQEEATYKDKPIRVSFQEFKQDMVEIWRRMYEIYKEEQEKIDLKKLTQEINDINKPKPT